MTPTDVTWYRRRWFKVAIISLVATVILASLVIGVLFVKWNASPEKALFDASEHALKTPGTYQVKAKNIDIKVDVNGQKYAASGTVDGAKIDVVISSNTLYIKSPDLEKLYDMFLAESVPKLFQPQASSILPTLRDKWISMNLQSLPASSTTIANARCGFDGKEILAADNNSRQQVTGVYLAHPFLDINTSSLSPDATKYRLSVDDKKFSSFYESFSKTGFYQSLTGCPQTTATQNSSNLKDVVATVILTQSANQLKSFSVVRSGSTIDVTADYSKAPTITAPTTAVSYEQISNNILQSYLRPFLSGR